MTDRLQFIVKSLGVILIVSSVTYIFPIIVGSIYDNGDQLNFFLPALISLVSGLVMFFSIPKSILSKTNFRDGFAVVTFSWVIVSCLGALPYYLSGVASLTDSIFESFSGFTSTGASIFSDIASLPQSILFWRSFSQWLGGMGVIVLFLAIMPYFDMGGMSIYEAEASGPSVEKLTPRIQDTAKFLWLIYFSLTVINIIVFYALGMEPFDSISHGLTTISTGGFSTKNNSFGFYDSLSIINATTFFMFCGGINFTLHYKFIFSGFKLKNYFDTELVVYFFFLFTLIVLVSLTIFEQEQGVFETVSHTAFNIVSISTSTGFATVNYSLWPIFGQFVILTIMLIGGCAGSTSGGIKVIRVVLIFKALYFELLKTLHPSGIYTVKLNRQQVEQLLVNRSIVYVMIYMLLLFLMTALISFDTPDMLTAFSAVIASMSAIGPGLGEMIGAIREFCRIQRPFQVFAQFRHAAWPIGDIHRLNTFPPEVLDKLLNLKPY